ncbi:L-2-amino-thiazoline-4-carboxylic acid hydrolase [Desulfopila sp. IMCC35008]|uniref:L-2-amino-thiazoline-4-carboxylic acid hydrolase n=1 Tax=Desulfopila sp. IMCC35008 TaxID=2653858 RepID=UPI0013D6C971|nr:L-2-amino-thiazoline-4-carboxylic acid hydrolase [Desulfopila sp. IMCC35008]
MSSQIIGYYIPYKKKLLRKFGTTSERMRASVVARYGEEFTNTLQKEVRQQYDDLIPEIPYIRGPRARMLNTFLLISAQELAVYRAMAEHGKSPGEAWELCHKALRLRLSEIPQWKRRIMRQFMFSRVVRRIMAKRFRKKQKTRFGDFEIEYLIGEGDDFDFGVNYLQCGNYEFVKRHGGEEFAPYVCMSDIALGEAMGWGLRRTQTLADGCPHCDFRFKDGATTHISSKTLRVQETIVRIRKREAEQGSTTTVERRR